MKDNTVIIRPPSEATSFLLPVTLGCSNNTCTFCGTYKGTSFRIRDFEDIKEHIDLVARSYSWSIERVFLENGDALICRQPFLVKVLEYLRSRFPRLERVGTYASPRSALLKSVDELRELNDLGLKIAYLGLESGDEDVLRHVRKGATRDQIIEAGKKLKAGGIATSVTVILGLGGADGSEKHATATAGALSEIDPDFASALTLMLVPGTPLYEEWRVGDFTLISPFQSLMELKLIIERSEFTDCFFTSNHASNYLPIRARLPGEKEKTIRLIDDIVQRQDTSRLRPDYIRGL